MKHISQLNILNRSRADVLTADLGGDVSEDCRVALASWGGPFASRGAARRPGDSGREVPRRADRGSLRLAVGGVPGLWQDAATTLRHVE